MKIKKGKERKLQLWLDKHTDTYNRSCLAYANVWACLMESKMMLGGTPEQVIRNCAEKYSQLAYGVTGGESGLVYGCAVAILCEVWEYGDTLKQWYDENTQ